MRICSSCGANVGDNAKFCKKCGHLLQVELQTVADSTLNGEQMNQFVEQIDSDEHAIWAETTKKDHLEPSVDMEQLQKETLQGDSERSDEPADVSRMEDMIEDVSLGDAPSGTASNLEVKSAPFKCLLFGLGFAALLLSLFLFFWFGKGTEEDTEAAQTGDLGKESVEGIAVQNVSENEKEFMESESAEQEKTAEDVAASEIDESEDASAKTGSGNTSLPDYDQIFTKTKSSEEKTEPDKERNETVVIYEIATSAGYILEDVASHRYTEEEIYRCMEPLLQQGYSMAEALRLARNECYALFGRVFKDNSLNDYFYDKNRALYSPDSSMSAEDVAAQFNSYIESNILTIMNMEKNY